jgi:2,3-dihydroxyphenylpropionate 1,2-dioxygenase
MPRSAGPGRSPTATRRIILAHEPDKRAQYVADAAAYADRFKLAPEQRQALIALDVRTIVAMGAHPLVPFLANMQVQRLRGGR